MSVCLSVGVSTSIFDRAKVLPEWVCVFLDSAESSNIGTVFKSLLRISVWSRGGFKCEGIGFGHFFYSFFG